MATKNIEGPCVRCGCPGGTSGEFDSERFPSCGDCYERFMTATRQLRRSVIGDPPFTSMPFEEWAKLHPVPPSERHDA